MNAEHINPFISVSTNLLQQVCSLNSKRGKIFLKESPLSANDVVIMIGIAGSFKGQVFLSMGTSTACDIASGMMMGMAVTDLDEMAKSAIAELGNMIMGNVCTEFYNKGERIDITPPTVLVGSNMSISTKGIQVMCIPLELDNGTKIEIDVALQD